MKKNRDLIRAASDAGSIVLPTEADIRAGLLCAANESSFNQAFFSEPLTTFMVGWQDPDNLEEFLNFVAPEVECGRRFEYKKGKNNEVLLSESDDVRALDADFKRVEVSGETGLGITLNKGLTLFVDLDRVAGIPNWENRYSAWLWNRLMRNEVRRAINGLSSAATNVNKVWGTKADPDMDLMDAIDLSGDDVGLEPNRCVIGRSAWIKRCRAFRAQNSAGGFASSAMTPEQLAAWLGIESMRICKSRYQTSATAKSKILGDVALFFMAIDNAIPDDPSNIKRFRSNVDGGGKMRVYRQERSSKIVSLSVEHYSNIIITTSGGIRKVTVTQAPVA